MQYILKMYDIELMYFEMESSHDGIQISNINIIESNKQFLPLGIREGSIDLKNWLKTRVIPRNRAYVSNFLSEFGLNEKDTKGILDISKGLSLNDSYWIVESDSKIKFDDYNLFDNSFNKTIGEIAFTGYGSFEKSGFRSSPEFTTGGMLAKVWSKRNGKIWLYKSGSVGFSNSGKEPYSEYYASMVAETMGIKHVDYQLGQKKGFLCSKCELFNTKDISFIAIGSLIPSGGIKAVMDYYKKLGENFYEDLIDMLVFDAVILNEDRHLGNFGVLIDNKTNKIIDTAPNYDHGLSLLHQALDYNLENLDKYVSTRRPVLYDDFIEFVKPLMSKRQRDKLRKLVDYKFKESTTKHKLNRKRLKILEELIQNRVQELLK